MDQCPGHTQNSSDLRFRPSSCLLRKGVRGATSCSCSVRAVDTAAWRAQQPCPQPAPTAPTAAGLPVIRACELPQQQSRPQGRHDVNKPQTLNPHPGGAVQRLRSDAFIELLLASARSLCPLIRRFLSMGLNRVWLKAGHTAYQYAPTRPAPGCILFVAVHHSQCTHFGFGYCTSLHQPRSRRQRHWLHITASHQAQGCVVPWQACWVAEPRFCQAVLSGLSNVSLSRPCTSWLAAALPRRTCQGQLARMRCS